MINACIMLSIALMVTVALFVAITWGELHETPRREAAYMALSVFGATLASQAMCLLLMAWLRG